MPQVLQNQCLAVPVLNVYSARFSLSRDLRDDFGMTKPRNPGRVKILRADD